MRYARRKVAANSRNAAMNLSFMVPASLLTHHASDRGSQIRPLTAVPARGDWRVSDRVELIVRADLESAVVIDEVVQRRFRLLVQEKQIGLALLVRTAVVVNRDLRTYPILRDTLDADRAALDDAFESFVHIEVDDFKAQRTGAFGRNDRAARLDVRW